MGIMLVYDITQEKSFENIKNWIRNIEENASTDVEKMLLGNKCELNEKRQVTKDRGEQLAIEYGIKFLETSAKNSINVEDAFFTLARDIKSKMEKRMVSLNYKMLSISLLLNKIYFRKRIIHRRAVAINWKQTNRTESLASDGCQSAISSSTIYVPIWQRLSQRRHKPHKHTQWSKKFSKLASGTIFHLFSTHYRISTLKLSSRQS